MNSDEVEKWIRIAAGDLKVAKKLFVPYDETEGSFICFHLQQCCEKYIKAFLIYKDSEVEKIHNLFYLQQKAKQFNNELEKFDFKNLNDFAVQFRYPGEDILPDKEEIKYYIDLCENLQKFDLTLLLNN